MSLEVVSGGGRGEKVLTFKVVCHTCGRLFFSLLGEVERGEKNKGGEEGDINSAECLGYYPLPR